MERSPHYEDHTKTFARVSVNKQLTLPCIFFLAQNWACSEWGWYSCQTFIWAVENLSWFWLSLLLAFWSLIFTLYSRFLSSVILQCTILASLPSTWAATLVGIKPSVLLLFVSTISSKHHWLFFVLTWSSDYSILLIKLLQRDRLILPHTRNKQLMIQ